MTQLIFSCHLSDFAHSFCLLPTQTNQSTLGSTTYVYIKGVGKRPGSHKQQGWLCSGIWVTPPVHHVVPSPHHPATQCSGQGQSGPFTLFPSLLWHTSLISNNKYRCSRSPAFIPFYKCDQYIVIETFSEYDLKIERWNTQKTMHFSWQTGSSL